jgi:hypothetical protein
MEFALITKIRKIFGRILLKSLQISKGEIVALEKEECNSSEFFRSFVFHSTLVFLGS